jgi:tetratricopeptide (TPR) repeat protein
MLETRRFLMGSSKNPAKTLERAAATAEKAVALDPNSAVAHMAYAPPLALQGKRDAAVAEAELATRLNPSSANAYITLGGVLYWSGRSAEALAALERAMRFSPRDRLLVALRSIQALCNADLGNLGAAEAFAGEAETAGPKVVFARLALAVILVRADRIDEARAAVAEVRSLRPSYRFANVAAALDGMAVAQRDRFLGDLRKAGLTD